MEGTETYRTIIVGGGQAGLAAAYYLLKQGDEFIILNSSRRTGDTWRARWDSLRLFTPAKFNGLPGLPFPGEDFYFPTKDETAVYLEVYERTFRLPVRHDERVDSLSRDNGSFQITAGNRVYSADNVIVATGPYQIPSIPAFARELDPAIVQIHSSAYKNPGQLPGGTVLVVGAGNSGAEIAVELARTGRKVIMAGRDVGRIPSSTVGRLLGGRPYWMFISRIMSVDTPIGRKVRKKALHQGTPLIRLSMNEVTAEGVQRCGRISGVLNGKPQREDGAVLDVSGVIWATGFRPDFGWIKFPVFDRYGLPVHDRGVVPAVPGLYFLGLHFQRAISSSLIGGVGVDAAYVTSAIMEQPGSGARAQNSRVTVAND